MFRTPLKNSKSVNKPFKSPFDSSSSSSSSLSSTPKTELTRSNEKNVKAVTESPLSARTVEAKRILKLDDDNEPERKKPKLVEVEGDKIKKVVPENATKSDLHALKRKIFELRQELDCLKSRERCTKRHDPKDLRASIDKWRSACQNALEIICSELTERNGQSSKISDVLKMLGIPEDIVHYSEKEDMFV